MFTNNYSINSSTDFRSVWKDFDKLFENFGAFFGEIGKAPDADDRDSHIVPASYVKQNADGTGTSVKILLPGFTKDDVKVKVKNNFITIVCDTEDLDRSVYKFKKALKCTDSVDMQSIKVKMKDGLLSINLAYKKAKEKDITIE